MDNAVAAAAYLLGRACEHALLARSRWISRKANLKEIVPFIQAAKEITREKRLDRAETKLARFLSATVGRDEKERLLKVWREEGISRGDMAAATANFAYWKFLQKTLDLS